MDESIPDLIPVEDYSIQQDDVIVPITLLTGYLGSGKTTLLNYILTAQHGYRIAVCMNDFGDSTDIEATSMSFTPNPTSTTGSDVAQEAETAFLSLPNGCLCCSIKEPGITAIENMIMERGGKEGVKGIDRVVVELTGVADPAEIAKSFWTNEEMGGKLRLDGVVCVVDSLNVLEQLKDGEECQKQIAASDVILLNKIDLVTAEDLDVIEGVIRSINPTATFKRTQRSAIDITHIFEIGGYSVAATLDAEQVSRRLQSNTATKERIQSLPAGDHAHTQHLQGISSHVIKVPHLDAEGLHRLEKFLQSIHWDSQLPSSAANLQVQQGQEGRMQILRSKGIFLVGDDIYVLQGVREIFELQKLNRRQDGNRGEVEGKLVVIGKDLEARPVWMTAFQAAVGVEML